MSRVSSDWFNWFVCTSAGLVSTGPPVRAEVMVFELLRSSKDEANHLFKMSAQALEKVLALLTGSMAMYKQPNLPNPALQCATSSFPIAKVQGIHGKSLRCTTATLLSRKANSMMPEKNMLSPIVRVLWRMQGFIVAKAAETAWPKIGLFLVTFDLSEEAGNSGLELGRRIRLG